MQGWNLESINPLLLSWGENLLAALGVVVVGWLAMRLLVGALTRVLTRKGIDATVVQFGRTVARILLMAVVAIVALERLGVHTTSMVAAMGGLGLAIGLALQDSLKNFAAGLMLIASRPFKAEDFVEAGGTSGIVEDVSLISTTMRTPDNRTVVIPNGTVFHDVITNYSARDRRRIDMVIGVSYGDDLDHARTVILDILAADERVLEEPAPVVAVHELADSSVNFVVRPWVITDDYWNVRWALTEKIKAAFDDQGVGIPFPQMDVRVQQIA